MTEKKCEGKPSLPEEPVGEDWIGDIGRSVQDVKAEMADIAREADEGMFDGPVGKVLIFLKRYWAVILVALIPWVPKLAEHWAENNPFSAMPEIITEVEFQEISDYIAHWDSSYEYAMNWVLEYDRDADGNNDVRVHAFAISEPEDRELYIRTEIVLPTLWQLITGTCGFAAQGEELALQDGQSCFIITVSGETKGDHSELRQAVENTLTAIHEEQVQQASGTYIPPEKPTLQELIDLLLEAQMDEHGGNAHEE